MQQQQIQPYNAIQPKQPTQSQPNQSTQPSSNQNGVPELFDHTGLQYTHIVYALPKFVPGSCIKVKSLNQGNQNGQNQSQELSYTVTTVNLDGSLIVTNEGQTHTVDVLNGRYQLHGLNHPHMITSNNSQPTYSHAAAFNPLAPNSPTPNSPKPSIPTRSPARAAVLNQVNNPNHIYAQPNLGASYSPASSLQPSPLPSPFPSPASSPYSSYSSYSLPPYPSSSSLSTYPPSPSYSSSSSSSSTYYNQNPNNNNTFVLPI